MSRADCSCSNARAQKKVTDIRHALRKGRPKKVLGLLHGVGAENAQLGVGLDQLRLDDAVRRLPGAEVLFVRGLVARAHGVARPEPALALPVAAVRRVARLARPVLCAEVAARGLQRLKGAVLRVRGRQAGQQKEQRKAQEVQRQLDGVALHERRAEGGERAADVDGPQSDLPGLPAVHFGAYDEAC